MSDTTYTYPNGMAVGDEVRVIGSPALVGKVTYPGARPIPERVYVRFAQTTGPRPQSGVTIHYHKTEIERTAA